jgi:hypothetical protein
MNPSTWSFRFSSIAVHDGSKSEPHALTSVIPPAVIFAPGDYSGGAFCTERWVDVNKQLSEILTLDVRMPTLVNLNWRHWDEPFVGRRFAIVRTSIAQPFSRQICYVC